MAGPVVPSRLAARSSTGPVRGVGSGFAENQRMAGASDPDTAARLAAADPSEVSAAMEQQEKLAEEISQRREELLAAITEGRWSPPNGLPPGSNWAQVLARQDAKLINDWHAEFKKAVDEALEKNDEEAIRDSIQSSFAVQPDDPLYDPMVDRARRKRIEDGLAPLDFESMVFRGFVEQDIKIHPSLVITMRTLTTQQGLWLEYYVAQQPEMSRQLLSHTFSLLQVAVALEKINGKPCTPSLEKLIKQDQREEFFKAVDLRMERLSALPSLLSDDFIIQWVWFTGRVRKLLAGNLTERVGNY